MHQMNLTGKHRIFHSDTQAFTSYPEAHGSFYNIDHITQNRFLQIQKAGITLHILIVIQ